MTIGEILELETKLGHRPTQQEIYDEETSQLMEIKPFVNRHGYSDVEPFEVIKTISPICVEVRAMKTVQTKFPKDFHVGGFVGHFADNREGQEYEYTSNPDAIVFRLRWSRAKRQWQSQGSRFRMADKPYKFYDYNF